MRNTLHTRRELLKSLLAASVAVTLPGIGFPSNVLANQESAIQTVSPVGVANRIAQQLNRPVTTIKVVGVGGAGSNAIEPMIQEGLRGGEFICVDTDAQKLHRSSAKTKILLGHGCGAAGKPEIARDMGISARSGIANALYGTDVVFVVAGLGGGTGTGVAPVIAEVARELGVLTVATVTTPYEFEGRRVTVALVGMKELNEISDALIHIPHERLVKLLGNPTSMSEAYRIGDRQIGNAIKGLVDNLDVTLPGMVNLDLGDLQLCLKGSGVCVTGSATESGDDRARIATMRALYQPFMAVPYPSRRGFIVFNIASGRQLAIREICDVFHTLRRHFSRDATIMGGAVFDDTMKDKLRVTLVAGGPGNSILPEYRI